MVVEDATLGEIYKNMRIEVRKIQRVASEKTRISHISEGKRIRNPT
jgi:hypothetical protein